MVKVTHKDVFTVMREVEQMQKDPGIEYKRTTLIHFVSAVGLFLIKKGLACEFTSFLDSLNNQADDIRHKMESSKYN